jgi:capsular polysaccharide biosynthesis protein
VELNEAFRRIVGQHWRLMLCFLLVGVGVAALVQEGASKRYTATTRLVLDTQDPKSRAEAAVISDTGEAIATSPEQVRAALSRRQVRRDALDVAAHHVSVHQLGTSGVLELSVSDASPKAAQAIADALAAQVIRVRNAVSTGDLRQVLRSIDAQISHLNRQTAAIDASGTTGPERDLLAQRRSTLEGERVTLLSNQAQRPKPSIISAATLPSHPTTSHELPILALGGILGLLIGLGVAGVIELMRPTLVGEAALAREFDAPLLGRLSSNSDASPSLASLRDRVRVAGEAAGVDCVRLLAAGPSVDLKTLATALANGRGPRPQPPHPPKTTRRSRPHVHDVTVDVFDVHTWSPNGAREGLAVVSPVALKQGDVMDANRLLGLSKLPVLGVITYENATSLRGASARKLAAWGSIPQSIANAIRDRVPQ